MTLIQDDSLIPNLYSSLALIKILAICVKLYTPSTNRLFTMKYFILFSFLASFVHATPPACFLSCIAETAKECPSGLQSISCLCSKSDVLVSCLVDICPYGNFESARDHFLGTCLEHSKATALHVPEVVLYTAASTMLESAWQTYEEQTVTGKNGMIYIRRRPLV